MKKFTKFCALAGLILLLAGSGITAGAALLGGRYPYSGFHHEGTFWRGILRFIDRWDGFYDWDEWYDWDDWDDWDDWSDADGVPESQLTLVPQDLSSVKRLDLDISKGSLNVHKVEGLAQIQVFLEDKFNKTDCFTEGNTLKIRQRSYRYKNYSPKIEIQLPPDLHLESVVLDTGVGTSEIKGISTSRLDMDTGVGSILFAGEVTENVELDTGVGDVTLELSGSDTDYNYTLDCGVGSVRIGETHYSGLSRSESVDNQASRNMDLDCGVGNVTISFTNSL